MAATSFSSMRERMRVSISEWACKALNCCPSRRDMVLKAADEYDVPIDSDGITIRRVSPDVYVDMTYTRNIVLVPGIYATDWTFTQSTSARQLAGVGR